MFKYLLIFINIVCTGGYMVILKNYANDKDNNPLTMSIYNGIAYGLAGTLIGASYFLNNTWTYDPVVIYAFIGGVFANLGGIPYLLAMPKAPGSVIQPLIGMTYPLIALGGLFIFREPINTKVICGIACGFIAIYLFNSEDKSNKEVKDNVQ